MTVKRSALRALPLAVVAACAFVSGAQAVVMAGAARTFVSSTGEDSNASANCAQSSPCRHLSTAIGVTAPGGEIVALDSAPYGAFTIDIPVSIVGVEPILITPVSGGDGITIAAGSGNVVILRNFQITGGGGSNTTGIQVNSGRLVLQNSTLKLLTTGLSVSNTIADVTDTDIIGNTTGIATTGTGTDNNCSFPFVFGTTSVLFSGGNVTDNGTAYVMHSPGVGVGASCTANRITIFVNSPNNLYTVNQTGNTTLVTGDGTGCTTSGNCTAIGTYLSTINQQGQ
jgi:hypothetical protein